MTMMTTGIMMNKNAWWDTTMFDNETDYLNWYNSIYSNDD